jgi:outer membrane protein TolC
VVAAESRYRQALERARETAVNARSEVREAYALQQGQYAVARHLRDEVVPLKQRISEETLLRYNGMLVGVFELLADARSQIASVNAAIESQRDFWLADADLQMALVGTPGKTMMAPSTASAPAEAGGGH